MSRWDGLAGRRPRPLRGARAAGGLPGIPAGLRAGEGDERLLPTVEVGETLQPTEVEAKRHETQPPPRYTEASLVRKLEEDGLGRPSTYASILSTIQDRGYVFTQGNALVPTFLATP